MFFLLTLLLILTILCTVFAVPILTIGFIVLDTIVGIKVLQKVFGKK